MNELHRELEFRIMGVESHRKGQIYYGLSDLAEKVGQGAGRRRRQPAGDIGRGGTVNRLATLGGGEVQSNPPFRTGLTGSGHFICWPVRVLMGNTLFSREVVTGSSLAI